MNAHELNKTIVQLIGKLIDKPLSSIEIEYAPETYKYVIDELRKNFLHVDNKTLKSILRANAKMLMVICNEIIQTTALEIKVNDIISNRTIEKQEDIPVLHTDRAYEIKAFELTKSMTNAINKLLNLPDSGRLEDIYTPEIHEPKIEELKKNLEHIKEKERKWIASSALILLLICDVILSTLGEERPNLVVS